MQMRVEAVTADTSYCQESVDVVWGIAHGLIEFIFEDTDLLFYPIVEKEILFKKDREYYIALENKYKNHYQNEQYYILQDSWKDWYLIKFTYVDGVSIYINRIHRQPYTYLLTFPSNLCN